MKTLAANAVLPPWWVVADEIALENLSKIRNCLSSRTIYIVMLNITSNRITLWFSKRCLFLF